MKKVLVLCTGNSCRSQIAEGYLRHFAAGDARAVSEMIKSYCCDFVHKNLKNKAITS